MSLPAFLADPPPLKEPIVATPYDRFGRQFRPHRLDEDDTHIWYRLVCFSRPIAPWRRRRRDALQDALDMGHASVSKRYRSIFLTVPADIIWVDLARGAASHP